MYIVLELQETQNSVLHLFNTYNTISEAESAWHTVLAAAAISSLSSHSAILMTSDGQVLRNEAYHHEQPN